MRTRTRGIRAAVAVLPLAMAFALTGCGSGNDDKQVASANSSKDGDAKTGGTGKDGGSSGTDADGDEKIIKFAQCMRENGIDMEDPKDGRITIQGGDKAKMDKAMKACQQYQPQGMGKGKADPKIMEGMRNYAKCMRENGVEEFPDPHAGGIRIDGSMRDDPNFKDAEQKCKDSMPKRPDGSLNEKG
ncbi:hypothetical protein ACWEFL_16195 [Streptomyces sp. NPDC004838]